MNEYERSRLYALRQLNLLDTSPSESFDRITRMASQLFGLPIAAVSLTDEDRQWFKSRVGVAHTQIPRFKACCGEVADTCELLVVEDLLESDTYRDSQLAQSGIRFYAGAPLLTHDGYTLGAMCVLGTEPRTITPEEMAALKDMAAMVMSQIDLQHAFGRTDPLTRLPNYSQFLEDLEDRAKEDQSILYAMSTELVELSEISAVQGVMGRAYLDEMTRSAARCLSEALPSDIKLYYMGPGQFAHICTASSDEEALAQALTLREQLLTLDVGEVAPFILRPVVGVAPFELERTTPADVLRTAHSACRDARRTERGIGIYSSTLDAAYQRSYNLLAGFRQALAHDDQLHLVYQPRINVTSGQCVGAEALLRWQHPVLGPVSPAEFIPLIENTPLARALTAWVLDHAIPQIAQWVRQGLKLRVSVNIAAANLEEENFVRDLLQRLDDENLSTDAIELELTESGLIGNGQVARQQLAALADAGLRIAIDDFGTGYSSLAYLQDIPAQVVKIDRSFIGQLETSARSRTLVNSMISMAQSLGYEVVAEGVETWACHHQLEELGCNEVQGYLHAKPLPPREFESWLENRVPA